MKKITLLIILIFIFCYLNISYAESVGIKIPKDIMEQAVVSNNATALITDYLIPMLNSDTKIALIFAAELNISNGRRLPNPYNAPFGERGMFGKLIYAPSLFNKDHTIKSGYEINVYKIRNEAIRLLIGEHGKWLHPDRGQTKFTFSTVRNVRILSYETGRWEKHQGNIGTICIDHIVEYMGGKRRARLECDYKTLIDNSYYLVTFRIVRK